jgi:hypothetical protein
MLTEQDIIRNCIDYDPDTGIMVWKISCSARSWKGARIGWKTKTGYLRVQLNHKKYLLHRLAWFFIHGSFPDNEIDHINGDKSDNRLVNLREVTRAQNMCNQKTSSVNTTGFKGVTRRGDRFRAQIQHEGEYHFIGSYDTPEEAHQAYCKKADELHGDFSRHE